MRLTPTIAGLVLLAGTSFSQSALVYDNVLGASPGGTKWTVGTVVGLGVDDASFAQRISLGASGMIEITTMTVGVTHDWPDGWQGEFAVEVYLQAEGATIPGEMIGTATGSTDADPFSHELVDVHFTGLVVDADEPLWVGLRSIDPDNQLGWYWNNNGIQGTGAGREAGTNYQWQFNGSNNTLGELMIYGADYVASWDDLGGGTPGVNGDPVLAGVGDLSSGSNNDVDLSNAAAGATAGLFIAVGPVTPVPFKGGTLVPVPFIEPLILTTNGLGEIPISFVMPPAIPAGVEIHVQWAIQDGAAVAGVALSNAIKGTTP